jgi:hypothetical protein
MLVVSERARDSDLYLIDAKSEESHGERRVY